MEKIKKINITELENRNIGAAAKAALICHLVNKIIKEIFDKEFLKEIKVISFKEGFIYFSATSPSYIQEIKIKEGEILQKTNNLLGRDLVDKIKFRSKKEPLKFT